MLRRKEQCAGTCPPILEPNGVMKQLNRTHRDIKAEILDYALHHKEITATKMFYKSELSWTQVCKTRKTLVNMGFLRPLQKGVKTFFFITVKGREWLSLYRKMRELEK